MSVIRQPQLFAPKIWRPPVIFNPASLPNLIAWYDGQRGLWKDTAGTSPATLQGDSIARWDDQSGNANHATQAVSANRPTLQLSWTNGKNAIQNTSSVWLASSAFTGGDVSQANTIYLVAQMTSTTPAGLTEVAFGGIASAKRNDFIYERGNTKWNLYGGTAEIFDTSLADTSNHVHSCLFNGSSGYHYIDNTSSLGTGNIGSNALSGITIGNYFNHSLGWIGFIAEIIIYNANHSTNNRIAVQNYLAAKYGITMH